MINNLRMPKLKSEIVNAYSASKRPGSSIVSGFIKISKIERRIGADKYSGAVVFRFEYNYSIRLHNSAVARF